MNLPKSKVVTKLLSVLFAFEFKDNADKTREFHEEQFKLLGTPNFIYKGETYIIQKLMPVKPLHDGLRLRFKEFLSNKKIIDDGITMVHAYLTTNMGSVSNNSDIYFIMPAACHYLIEEAYSSKGSEATLTEKPKDYDKIVAAIEQILLLRLL